MGIGLMPRLSELTLSEWKRHYPNGLGASAFTAPAWQHLMRDIVGPDFELRALVTETSGKRFSLPVFVRQWRYKRMEILTHPIAYYVLPIESETADAECVRPLIAAARTVMTSSFKWWLPPWLTGEQSGLHPDVETYVIQVEGDVDEFLQRTVRKRYLEYVRSSYKKGIEIVEQPSSAEIVDYFALYRRTYQERNWVGELFPLPFFEGVASTLGDGGKLVLMRHAGKIVGGGVVLFDNYALHYFQGATDRENNAVKPHLVLYDWLVRTASARGLRYVNLGGVNEGNESLSQFKQGWGAKPMWVPHVCFNLDRAWLGERLGLSRIRHWAAGATSSAVAASAEVATHL